MSKNCQSCAMPMSKDPGQGGTEMDGSKSDQLYSEWLMAVDRVRT